MSKLLLSALLLLSTESFAQALIKIDGSSTVFPITEAMAEEFQAQSKGKVRVTVGISGTGGGFKKFCRGETDVQNASRPITSQEMEACKSAGIKYIELPVGYDATAIIVNLKNDWLKEIATDDLKKMWEPGAQGKVMKWSDVNAKWPAQALKLYGAGADSGTFDYFTEAIVGKAKSSRGDYTASEDDNTLISGVANDKGAIGYVPLAYAVENTKKVKIIGVVGGDKAPKKTAVMPSKETVEDGSYFPLSRPIFIYVNAESLKKAEVKDFGAFYLKNASSIVPQVKYVALPAKAYELAAEHLKNAKLGTIFAGKSEVGLKIETLLKREGTL